MCACVCVGYRRGQSQTGHGARTRLGTEAGKYKTHTHTYTHTHTHIHIQRLPPPHLYLLARMLEHCVLSRAVLLCTVVCLAVLQAEADRAAAAAATSDTPPHSTTEGSPNPNDSPADSAGLTANQPAEQLISISTNCDVTDEGQGVVGSGRVPSCRIAGLHDEQARVILEQVR